MTSDRNSSGGFTDGLGLGASAEEQQRAGVNSRDTSGAAVTKVLTMRGGSQTYGTDWAALGGMAYWAIAAVFALAALFLVGGIASQTLPDNMFTGHVVTTTLGESQFKDVFPPGIKLARTGEREISWKQLLPLRDKALRPATFDQDICTIVNPHADRFTQAGWPNLAQWRITPKGRCEVENAAELNTKLRHHNTFWTIAVWVVAIAAFVGLIYAHIRIRWASSR